MFDTYKEIYETRGGRYHEAMRETPEARAREFEFLIKTANFPDTVERVLDIPSGGGYIRPYLRDDIQLVSVDPAPTFLHSGEHVDTENWVCAPHDALPFAEKSFDAILSLAGLHHVANHVSVFQEWHRILKPGGILAVADASKDSPTSRFLDGVVNAYNSQGHQGNYFTPQVCDELRQCGYSVHSAQELSYTWNFSSRGEMLHFCRTLFGMDRHPTDRELLEGIDQTVGYHENDDGAFLHWSLFFFCATV